MSFHLHPSSRPSTAASRRTGSLRLGAATPVLALALALAVPVTANAQFGKNKVQYRDFDWQIYHSTHFDVHYYSAEEHLLQKMVSMAESAYDHLSQRFDYQIEEPTPLIFYKTHAEFEQNNIIRGLIPEAVGAFATNVRFRMVLPVDLPDDELYALILHELTHIFQYHIIFGGRVGRGLTSQPPTWLMEGMASYYAEDESTADKMFLRDAVVNDAVPPITQARGGGFFAYRFGHAAFDFMEERWGPEGVIDFLYEFRSSLGGQVDRALTRAFRIEPEDFDADFRRWLRDRYLPELVATGEPSYFGRRFYDRDDNSNFFSPVVSPSGDLVAALGNPKGDIDVILLDSRNRRPLKNLTKGWTSDVQYITAQFATSTRRRGGDLAFSADGNYVAAFARREAGRSLVLIDVLKGGIERVIDLDVQQPFSPAWSPDGQTVAFAGTYEGQFDIFTLDVATGEVANVTDDIAFDGGPAYSPDGRHLVYSSEFGTYAKLVRLDVADPSKRQQLTVGEFNDVDVTYHPDGDRLFYTSDRNGFDNIYSLDLESGEIRQHTNAVTGCFIPTVLERGDGTESLVYGGFWDGRFDIYRHDFDEDAEIVDAIDVSPLDEAAEEPLIAERFEPDIQVAIDDGNKEEYGGFKLFLEDGDLAVGVTSDQRFLGQTFISFSDQLGDRRLVVALSSVSSFSDFDVLYTDLSDRLQWGIHVFDDRTFFVGIDQGGDIVRDSVFQQTGLRFIVSYPFTFHHRIETGLGYIFRDYDFQAFVQDMDGNSIPVITPREDDYPELSLSLVGDTAVFASFGPISGRRWRIGGSYAPDLDDTGEDSILTANGLVDVRQYIPVTRRSLVAMRAYGFASWGNFPNVSYAGGLDTVRGVEFRDLVGDRVFYANLEYRFPLIDALWFPGFRFQGIRGRIFLDVGGSYFDYANQTFDFWDNENDRLQDAVSSYGWGFSINLGPFQAHWDFAKLWDFDSTLTDGFETEFWIGARF